MCAALCWCWGRCRVCAALRFVSQRMHSAASHVVICVSGFPERHNVARVARVAGSEGCWPTQKTGTPVLATYWIAVDGIRVAAQ